MEEILDVNLPGFNAKYNVKWFEDTDFSKLNNVKQVYGIIFNNEGKVLIVNTVGNWQVPGGKPEGGESFRETLIRESMEEADVELEEIVPLGYQIVSEIKPDSLGKEFCQLRFFAKIKKLKDSTIDPATGKIPERKFINSEDFLNYCPWGKIGQHVVNKAYDLFKQKKQTCDDLDFMNSLGDLLEFKEKINDQIQEYHPQKIKKEYLCSVTGEIKYADLCEEIQSGLFEPNWDMLNRKRSNLRPILFLLAVGGLGKDPKEYLKFSSILETIHNGTLIHDDIEDNGQIRRGDKPTYLKYGLDIAVNSANLMYFSPFLLLKMNKNFLSDKVQIRAYESLIEHLNRVTWGQAIDILWHKTKKVPSIEEYLQMCCYKTGAIDRMVFSFAGVLCEVDELIQKKLEKFGEELGVFLQIHDDFSDVCSIHRELIGGKTIGNDISEGKKSLINIFTINSLESKEKEEFIEILSEQTKDKVRINNALRLIQKTNSLKKSLEFSELRVEELKKMSKAMFISEYDNRMQNLLSKMQEDMKNKYNQYLE